MKGSLSRIPPHLRKHIVRQDYSRYTEVDQAVWRFVLLHTYSRLKETAHPAYVAGLESTGLAVERIPRVEEMDACLSRFGWGAVCVDGFIPPRAFQALQGLRLLPIAAEIRTRKHLVYTPAPDIIHEAAGHAPILADAEYAAYLARVGSVGARAFTLPCDDDVYDAIYALSEIKEAPDATPRRVRRAEADLASAQERATELSEAARLARLYWWTAEYGLVGTPDDYKLYGAGLLSSLWESHSCHEPGVRKLPLGVECMDVGYDITREQPQLFVARDFDHLNRVLDEAERTLAHVVGGAYAVELARRSQDIATLELDGGVQVIGKVAEAGPGDGIEFLRWSGRTAIARAGRLSHDASPAPDLAIAVGPLADGRSSAAWASTLRERAEPGMLLELSFRSGLLLTATLHGVPRVPGVVGLRDVTLRAGDRLLFRHAAPAGYPIADRVVTAFAGASDDAFFPETSFPDTRVPRLGPTPHAELELRALYEGTITGWRKLHGSRVVPLFEAIHAELARRFPDEWLLRYNLLESLLRAGQTGELSRTLELELRNLEERFEHKEPIATALRRLRQSFGTTTD